jgi:hypothetical protein
MATKPVGRVAKLYAKKEATGYLTTTRNRDPRSYHSRRRQVTSARG